MFTILTTHQYNVYKAFTKADTDIGIAVIYDRVYDDPTSSDKTAREMQQKLAPTFAAINKKMKGARIEPGKTKRTYRLNTKGD